MLGGLDRLYSPNGSRFADRHIKAAPKHVRDHLPTVTGLRRNLHRIPFEDLGDMLFHGRLRLERVGKARFGRDRVGSTVEK
jgi:hypothetical protein